MKSYKRLIGSTIGLFLLFSALTLAEEGNFLTGEFNGKPLYLPKPYSQGLFIEDFADIGVVYPSFSPSQESKEERYKSKKTVRRQYNLDRM